MDISEILRNYTKQYGTSTNVFKSLDFTRNSDFDEFTALPMTAAVATTNTEHGGTIKDYSKKFSTEKYGMITNAANKWGKDPNSLAAIIFKESSGDERAVNANSGATGIIQFMPSTAEGLGTTTDAIKDMSFSDQLDLAGKYYNQFGSAWDKAQTATDMYALTFYPKLLNESNDYVIGSEKGDKYVNKVASQNKGFDMDSDGQITKAEFYEWGSKKMEKGGLLYKR